MVLPLTALIAGTARNCAAHLPRTLRMLDELRRSFVTATTVLVTNDSSDNTPSLLHAWASERENASIIVMDGLAEAVPQRTVRLALARNMYLRELRNQNPPCDLLIVADLDGVNDQLACGHDLERAIMSAPERWGALFANQRNAYYDIWALRHPAWCPVDCWAAIRRDKWPILNRFRRNAALDRHVWSRQVFIPPSVAPIEVDSAFGGFGIYRTAFLERAWYGGLARSFEEISEHVPFNEKVRRNGARLYIHPGILNDGPLEHLGVLSGRQSRPWCTDPSC